MIATHSLKTSTPKIALLSNHISGAVKLARLIRDGVQIDTVISTSQSFSESKGLAGFFNFEPFCKRNQIQLHLTEDQSFCNAKDQDFFFQSSFDFLLISGWQKIVPQELLQCVKRLAIAEHGSSDYLPKGRGRSPVGWTLISGAKRFVLHLFEAVPGVDSGPVLATRSFDILPYDTIKTLYFKIGLVSSELTQQVIRQSLDGTLRPTPQKESGATYFPKRSKKDDFIDWTGSTSAIADKIRAITRPYPGAITLLNTELGEVNAEEVKIWNAHPFSYHIHFINALTGEVVDIFPDESLLVKTSDGLLRIEEYESPLAIRIGNYFKNN